MYTLLCVYEKRSLIPACEKAGLSLPTFQLEYSDLQDEDEASI